MVTRLAIGILLAACGAAPQRTRALVAAAGDDITLYRDVALVRQRIELDVPAPQATLTVSIAAGVGAPQVLVLDRGGLELRAVRAASEPVAAPPRAPRDDTDETDTDEPDTDEPPPAEPPTAPGKPTDLALDIRAPHAGHYAIVLGYTTDRIAWDAAYTLTANPAHDAAVLHGALAIRNTTGVTLRGALHVIDTDLGPARSRASERLASSLIGGAAASSPVAQPRDIGSVVLGEGETRVELVTSGRPRPMRAVLVYDPIGTRLDNPSGQPLRDPTLGVHPAASTRVTESFEIARDEHASVGLPAGPVRLLERRADGSLGVLGESRLFDAAARVASVDTIPIGTAEGVVGHRQRIELTDDEERKRLVEEFVITLDNARPVPVHVLVREHLYRGQTWVLSYASVDTPADAKEGAQQIALRTDVPARGQVKIMYVVVYTWGA